MSGGSFYKGSNKLLSFDMNAIQNKLPSAGIAGPSTKNFQQSHYLREKNYQSDIIKQSMSQYDQTPSRLPPQRNPELPSVSNSGIGEKLMINQIKQYGTLAETRQPSSSQFGPAVQNRFESSRQNQIAREETQRIVGSNPQITRASNRATMYDFRKNSNRAYYMGDHGIQAFQKQEQPTSSQLKQQLNYMKDIQRPLGLHKPPLTPIKENDGASVINLPPPSSYLADPDNNILFLDNGSRVVNPVNAKTPPPPFWGEVLEEENYNPNESFYDHSKAEQEMIRRKFMEEKLSKHNMKLKRKIVYVYEEDSDQEKKNQEEKKAAQSMDSLQQQYQRIPSQKYQFIPALAGSSRRGVSSEMRNYMSAYATQEPYNLPRIQQQQPYINIQKPLNLAQKTSSSQQQLSSGRQIRTGGFSKLPTIMNSLASKPQ